MALRVLPARWRRDLGALYGFARLADQIGDALSPGAIDPDLRLRALDELEADLLRAFEGAARHPLLRALQPVVAGGRIPVTPFQRLIEANRRDQRVARYATWADLVDYSSLSANPVGEWVLHLAGAATPERLAWSDAVCTALQVLEHSQDVVEDASAGRVYLPQDDLARFGCGEDALVAGAARPELRRVVALQVARSRGLLQAGPPLVASLQGPARLAVAGFVAGGLATAEALEAAGCEVTGAAIKPRKPRILRQALRLWRGRGR